MNWSGVMFGASHKSLARGRGTLVRSRPPGWARADGRLTAGTAELMPDRGGSRRKATEGDPMARAVWTGQLVFGRVAIPVRLENVVQDKSVKAHLVHRKDKGRLHTKRICEKDGKEVPWEETARIVEVGNREVVDFEPAELKRLRLEREGEISLAGFTEPSAVDPSDFDSAHVVVRPRKQPPA